MMIGKLMMTVAVLQFTIIPLIADLNRSHATNPDWPGHARNHLVVQVLTTSAVGLLALFFLWSGRVDGALGLCIATMLAFAALLPFFISVALSPLYGGRLMPARIGIGRITLGRIEGNLLNFGSAAVLFLLGRLLA